MALKVERSRSNVPAGGGSDPAKVGGMLSVNTTTVGNDADTNEKTLISYTLPANTLSKVGMGVRITAVILTAANGNNKIYKLKFGSTDVDDSGVVTYSNEKIVIQADIFLRGVGSQKGFFTRQRKDGQFAERTVPSEDETAAIVIAVTGQSPTTGAAIDVQCDLLSVEFLNF